MFLHIGYSRIVYEKEIIGIFDMALGEKPTNKQFLESANECNFYLNSNLKGFKSFIVTDKGLFFSPVIPETLARRNRAMTVQNIQV